MVHNLNVKQTHSYLDVYGDDDEEDANYCDDDEEVAEVVEEEESVIPEEFHFLSDKITLQDD